MMRPRTPKNTAVEMAATSSAPPRVLTLGRRDRPGAGGGSSAEVWSSGPVKRRGRYSVI